MPFNFFRNIALCWLFVLDPVGASKALLQGNVAAELAIGRYHGHLRRLDVADHDDRWLCTSSSASANASPQWGNDSRN